MSMSIQSDVEILSVQAVEYYAQKHHLSEGDVFDLFCKHQVFEKILIQHETLHQLDMEETFQYVEEIIKENALELVKSSKKMLWNWYFTTVPTSHLMRLTWENPITAVTLAGDFTVPSWKAKRRNGPNVFICAPTKAADMFIVTCSARQRT